MYIRTWVAVIRLLVIFYFVIFIKAGSADINEKEDPSEGCTIGVAAGRATPDGRPLLWKTRDGITIDNEVYYQTVYPLDYVCVISAGVTSYSWMGVNEKGFAIINSASTDLPAGTSGMGNGSLMTYALGYCPTVAAFQHLLDSTNLSGRQTQANFGVIDSTGAAAIFETAATQYWKFDANDTIQAPDGYVLRTNFAFNGGGTGGIERYNRTCDLISDFYAGDSLNYRSLLRYQMRDFSDYYSNPFQVPYPGQILPTLPNGYIYTDVSICRNSTISTAVIHGVLPAEPANLSTLWVILGQPAGAMAVPYWPVGPTPVASNGIPTAPLCDQANLIRANLFDQPSYPNFINTYKLRNGLGAGVWETIFPSEDSIFFATDSALQAWRLNIPTHSTILAYEENCADYALIKLEHVYDILTTIFPENTYPLSKNARLYQNFPNPFNPKTVIRWQIEKNDYVQLSIFNMAGQRITTLVDEKRPAGSYQTQFDASGLASGVYYCRLQAGNIIEMRKMILLK
ncbi:MAG: T9SS type A sorting domain-containing protein [bacterium]|nr:MAG: T9SS type A sorting domain-containing protein [bacterium]